MYLFEIKIIDDEIIHSEVIIYKNGSFFKLHCVFKNYFGFSRAGSSEYFKTPEEVISIIKAMFDPFQDAIDKINASIEKNVADAKFKMHLRCAKFRGFLFDQHIVLKYGKSHKEYVLDQLIEEVSKPGVIGVLYNPTPNQRFVTSLLGKQILNQL